MIHDPWLMILTNDPLSMISDPWYAILNPWSVFHDLSTELILQPGVSCTLLYNGSRFTGHQKSKGNQYDVEVVLQVKLFSLYKKIFWQLFVSARWWGECLPMWLPKNQEPHWRISRNGDFFRRRNNQREASVPHKKVGRRRGRGQEALGKILQSSNT